MDQSNDAGRRLYKARGDDGGVAWVDRDELWRLQHGQAEELRRRHLRRRRTTLLALAGLVVLALALSILWWRWRQGLVTPATEAPGVTSPTDEVAAIPRAMPESATAASTAREMAAEPEVAAGSSAVDVESSPTAPAAEEPSVVGPIAEDQVRAAINDWVEAWARQDFAAYLGGYSADFDPPGDRTWESWRELRRRRLLAPSFIGVEIEGLEVDLVGAGLAEARFRQTYSSSQYSDVVRKTLRLVEEAGVWRIVSERAESL